MSDEEPVGFLTVCGFGGFEMKTDIVAKQIARQVECAHAAGIYDQMVLGFGSVLAVCREHGVNVRDDDDDIIFFADRITKEQEQEYVRLLAEPTKAFPVKGLCSYRFDQARRPDTERLFWVSIKGHAQDAGGRKCCHWFMWSHAGYLWHAKNTKALVKGIPAQLLEPGPEVTYMGTTIRVPKLAGACCDWWYPGNWMIPASGSSAPAVLMHCEKWGDPSTWTISR